jgi:hypothetical protein
MTQYNIVGMIQHLRDIFGLDKNKNDAILLGLNSKAKVGELYTETKCVTAMQNIYM